MDLLKKISGDDKTAAHSNPVTSEEDSRDTDTDKSGNSGRLLDKISDVLGGGENIEKQESHSAKAVEPGGGGNLVDKITDVLSAGSKAEKKEGGHDAKKESGHGGSLVDKISDAFGGGEKTEKKEEVHKSEQSGGLVDKINNALGGGQKGEKKEDGLDKAVDWVQEHVLGHDSQKNESAIEQAKDEAISDAIRGQYKKVTGHEFPIADK